MAVQRIILIINLVLLTLTAYLAAGLTYQFLGLRVQPAQSALITTPNSSTERRDHHKALNYYNALLERDLFKTKKAPQAPQVDKKIDFTNLEATQLKLKLWGTVAGLPDQTYAVIEDTRKREQQLYRVSES